MTIKGIEPELNRMSVAYQEELAELRRIHQSQIEEIEATWHRRMATMRDKMDAEREQAIVTERENSRNRYLYYDYIHYKSRRYLLRTLYICLSLLIKLFY